LLRTVFGGHDFSVRVYRDGENQRDPIVRRPLDKRLGISPDRYSLLLLQEYSMLFCCEQAFHGAVDAYERVVRHRLSADTLERLSQRMGLLRTSFCRHEPHRKNLKKVRLWFSRPMARANSPSRLTNPGEPDGVAKIL